MGKTPIRLNSSNKRENFVEIGCGTTCVEGDAEVTENAEPNHRRADGVDVDRSAAPQSVEGFAEAALFCAAQGRVFGETAAF